MGNRLDEELADCEAMGPCESEGTKAMPSKYLNDCAWGCSEVESNDCDRYRRPFNEGDYIKEGLPKNDCYWGMDTADNFDYEENDSGETVSKKFRS